MKQIVIKFEPFIFKQTVFIRDDENETIEKQEIPQKELVSFLSLQENLAEVHFFGNKAFAEKIKTECITKYKMKDINFSINK